MPSWKKPTTKKTKRHRSARSKGYSWTEEPEEDQDIEEVHVRDPWSWFYPSFWSPPAWTQTKHNPQPENDMENNARIKPEMEKNGRTQSSKETYTHGQPDFNSGGQSGWHSTHTQPGMDTSKAQLHNGSTHKTLQAYNDAHVRRSNPESNGEIKTPVMYGKIKPRNCDDPEKELFDLRTGARGYKTSSRVKDCTRCTAAVLAVVTLISTVTAAFLLGIGSFEGADDVVQGYIVLGDPEFSPVLFDQMSKEYQEQERKICREIGFGTKNKINSCHVNRFEPDRGVVRVYFSLWIGSSSSVRVKQDIIESVQDRRIFGSLEVGGIPILLEQIDECSMLNPCKNDATCVDLNLGYVCLCQKGFTGAGCETDLDECSIHNISCVHGTCVDMVDNFECACSPGYTGRFCHNDKNECMSNPCENHGTCEDDLNAYHCACVTGYSGINCEIEVDECASEPCRNQATCEDHINGFTCACATGYTGSLCDTATP